MFTKCLVQAKYCLSERAGPETNKQFTIGMTKRPGLPRSVLGYAHFLGVINHFYSKKCPCFDKDYEVT